MSLTQINKAGLDEIALDHVFTIGASGSSAYTFQGEGLNGTVNNPTLYLTRGKTYRFENGSGGHPIRIQSTSGASGTAYNTGVTNNAGSGTVIVEVQHDAPDVLYYQCTSHAAMNGILYITGALADGGVTTAKLADDAVTDAKLANSINSAIAANTAKTSLENNSVTTARIASNAVVTSKILDGAINNAKVANDADIAGSKLADDSISLAKLQHGTSSNDGKFLRANNGADPSFETVSIPAGTTINNNADNRIITGSGTANTLEGESQLTYDNSTNILKVASASSTSTDKNLLHVVGGGTATRGLIIGTGRSTGASQNHAMVFYDAQDGESNEYGSQHIFRRGGHNNMVIGYQSNNFVGIQTDYPSSAIHVTDTNPVIGQFHHSDGGTNDEARISLGALANNPPSNRGVNIVGQNNGAGHDFVVQCSASHSAGPSEKIRVKSSGGITFNGDTATANALDDYEEGTWTPQGNGFSITNTQSARYTKIGRLVHVTAYINCGSGSGTAAVIVNNLPFNTRGGNAYSYGTGRIGSAGSNTNSQNNIVWQTQSGSNQLKLYVNDGAINEQMISGQHMIFSIVYEH